MNVSNSASLKEVIDSFYDLNPTTTQCMYLTNELHRQDINEKKMMLERIYYLEHQYEQQKKENEKIKNIQKERLYKLEKKFDSMRSVLIQLIPSLFNYDTQTRMFEMHSDLLWNRLDRTDDYYNSLPNSGDTYATTRQGDANQARIVQLEKIVQQLLSRNAEEDRQEEMSGLSVDSNSSEERIKTSSSLCGNE